MKVLLIGMDGAHAEAFGRGWTPYISNMIQAGSVEDVEEGLISRG